MTALLDAIRAPVVRAAARRVPWLADRELRTSTLLGAHGALAALLATLAPSLLLLVGPLVLGVPHLVQDVRHLVLRRATWRRALLLFCAALLVVRIAAPAPTQLEAALTAGVLVAAGAPLLAAGLLAAALAAPEPFRVVLAHAHNLVALALWLRLYRARTPAAWAITAAIVAFAALLASGALVPLLVGQGSLTFAGYSILAAADTLAPGLPDTVAIGVTMSYAFLQSVHYAVWVTCIPLDAAGPRSFRQSLRAHRRDLGTPALAIVAAIAVALLVAGALAPLRAQSTYLALAGFHAYLELVAWALLRRDRP